MTDEQINAAIADACGWRKEDGVYMWTVNKIDCTYPNLWDWCNDLNAMHEAEWVLTEIQWFYYLNELYNVMRLPNQPELQMKQAFNATARQRAEALLRTLSKWEDSE